MRKSSRLRNPDTWPSWVWVLIVVSEGVIALLGLKYR